MASSLSAQQTITLRPIEGDDTAHIQTAIDQFATVNLLGEFEVSAPIYLDSGTRLNTPAATRATIRRTGATTQLLVLNGDNIRINRLRLDWGDNHPRFTCLIDFRCPEWSGRKPVQLRDVQVNDVDFVGANTSPHEGKDSWCVSFTSHGPGINEGVQLNRCRSLMPGVQLTGNGSGPGYDGLTIRRCETYGGRNAGIGLSSLNTETQTLFADVLIERCVIRGAFGVGIFVGQDGNTRNADVYIEGLTIRNNFIELGADGPDYPIGLLIRGGEADGCMVAASATGNIIDLRSVPAHRHPRTVVITPGSGGGKLSSFIDNLFFGDAGEHHATGMEVVKESGNRAISLDSSTELRLAK